MTISPIITGYLKIVVLGLTPLEKLKAVRSFDSGLTADRWFILIGIIVLIVLSVLFLVVSLFRKKQERKSSDQLFLEFARKRGLSARECQILFQISQKAGLKQSESIFTFSKAFDQGTTKMLKEIQADDPEATEKSNQLRIELSYLRQKLGYRQHDFSTSSPVKSTKLSSRRIPVGKKVSVIRQNMLASGEKEATVVSNNDNELGVRLTQAEKITFGEAWCVRYYSGSSVWEFDTIVISYNGDVFGLNHSDDVRFINRRRFLRIPVKMSAFIGCFPFEKMAVEVPQSDDDKDQEEDKDLKQPKSYIWGPPTFIRGIVTELAGPGLCIESTLDVKQGDRVLIVLNLSKDENTASDNQNRKPKAPKIIEAMGEVRHVRLLDDALSIAVELTGLSDSDVDEMIRITNAASVISSNIRKKSADFEDSNKQVSGAANV